MKMYRLRGGWFTGHEFKQARPETKGSVTSNKGGQAGSKRRKAHLNARGLPGTSMGICVRLTKAAQLQRVSCACGGCVNGRH